MQKGGKGDGVSRGGDSGMDDDALAAALESHFAPFAAGSRSVPVPIPHDDPALDEEGADEDGPDPEVTAITRRLDRTGDTLGAIDALEQLLIERTGQIPVVSPEILAAYAERAEATPRPEAEPQPESSGSAAPEEDETPEEASPDEIADEPSVDWSIPAPTPIEPAPGFSEWVDPDAIAAAYDPEHGREATDVSTKVFAVFSAPEEPTEEPSAEQGDEPEPEPTRTPEPEADPAHDPEPEQAQAADADEEELDGIDDLAGPHAEAPIPTPAPAAPAPPRPAEPVTPSQEEREPAPPRRRRFWPFGRR